MRKLLFFYIIMLTLFIVLQPLETQAAYIDLDNRLVYSKPGLYQQLDEVDRISESEPEQWVKSGNYTYQFLDVKRRYITIRKIESEAVVNGKLVVPKKIDGLKVLGIGVWHIKADRPPYEVPVGTNEDDYMSVVKKYSVIEKVSDVEELVLPSGLEFLGDFSFCECYGLRKIVFPDSLSFIGMYSLKGSRNLTEVTFPPDIYVSEAAFGVLPMQTDQIFHPEQVILYSDSLLGEDHVIMFKKERKPQIFIRFHKQKTFRFVLKGYVDKIFVHKKLDCFYLLSCLSEEEDYAVSPPPSYKVKKLVMNGKDTCLQLPYFSDKHSVLNKDGYWISGVKGIYTVKGAASINEAREYKATYYWKETGKAEKVKAKKKNGVYRAEWKKIKTTVYKHEYKAKKRKWKVTKSPVQTVYKVYGKKKKKGSYRLFMTTKKKNIQSKYKYIKAAAVKEWD